MIRTMVRELSTATPDEEYGIDRDKENGVVAVIIFENRISTQRADSIASGLYAEPVKLYAKASNAAHESGKRTRMDVRYYKTAWSIIE